MPIGIGSNIASLTAQRRLSGASSALSESYQRLSSGQRINKASDDAAGLAISSALNSRAQVYEQAMRNANDGISLYAIADSTVSALTDINSRLQELGEQSANGVYSTAQRWAIDAEAQALSKEYFRISRAAQFNGMRLFDGSMSSGLRLQLGYGTSGSIQSSVGGKLGNGAPSMVSTFTTNGYNTIDAKLADLNGDGVLDLVAVGASGPSTGGISIRMGDGAGGFGAASTFTDSGYFWASVALGDITGDGVQDIVVAGSNGGLAGAALVLKGNGNGSFQRMATYATETGYSAAVALEDINSDGVLDLLTAGSAAGSLGYATVRLGAGNGSFGSAVSYLMESSVSAAIAVADLNKDGRPDLITAGNDGTDGRVTVRLGSGGGSFGAGVSVVAGADASSLAIGDINGDGNIDVVAAGYLDSMGFLGGASVLLGSGSGTFSSSVSYVTSSMGGALGLGLSDLNGDGNLDLVTSQWNGISCEVAVMLGSNSGTFGAATTSSVGPITGGATVTIGDINGDGVTDVLASGQYSPSLGSYSGTTTVLLGNTRDGISPLQPFSLKTKGDALQALGLFARTAKNLSDIRGSLGATQSRVGTAIQGLASARENYIAARSRIVDVDVARESAELVRTRILQQSGAAVLAQSNLAPQLSLRLLG